MWYIFSVRLPKTKFPTMDLSLNLVYNIRITLFLCSILTSHLGILQLLTSLFWHLQTSHYSFLAFYMGRHYLKNNFTQLQALGKFISTMKSSVTLESKINFLFIQNLMDLGTQSLLQHGSFCSTEGTSYFKARLMMKLELNLENKLYVLVMVLVIRQFIYKTEIRPESKLEAFLCFSLYLLVRG